MPRAGLCQRDEHRHAASSPARGVAIFRYAVGVRHADQRQFLRTAERPLRQCEGIVADQRIAHSVERGATGEPSGFGELVCPSEAVLLSRQSAKDDVSAAQHCPSHAGALLARVVSMARLLGVVCEVRGRGVACWSRETCLWSCVCEGVTSER